MILYEFMRDGIASAGMPGQADNLTKVEMWHLVNYLRAELEGRWGVRELLEFDSKNALAKLAQTTDSHIPVNCNYAVSVNTETNKHIHLRPILE